MKIRVLQMPQEFKVSYTFSPNKKFCFPEALKTFAKKLGKIKTTFVFKTVQCLKNIQLTQLVVLSPIFSS